MSLVSLLKFGHRSIFSCLLTRFGSLGCTQSVPGSNFHSACGKLTNVGQIPNLLKPATPLIIDVSSRGMKTKGRLNLRCKDCYFVVRQGRPYVMCKTSPRHKQQAMVKKEKSTWILTHATQGKKRPWF